MFDLEAAVGSQAVRDRPHVRLVDLLDTTAAGAGQMMVVFWLAGDVGVHVALELETSRDPGLDERLEGAEYRCATDRRFLPPQMPVQLIRGELAARTRKFLGDEQPLTGDALPRRGEPRSSGQCRVIHASKPSTYETVYHG